MIRLRQNTLQLAAGITCCDGATARRDGYVAISLDTPQLATGSFIKQQEKEVGIGVVFN